MQFETPPTYPSASILLPDTLTRSQPLRLNNANADCALKAQGLGSCGAAGAGQSVQQKSCEGSQQSASANHSNSHKLKLATKLWAQPSSFVPTTAGVFSSQGNTPLLRFPANFSSKPEHTAAPSNLLLAVLVQSQPLKLMLDQDCFRQLNTNACQGLESCGAAGAAGQSVQPKSCERSQQYCVCRPKQQSKAEACHEVLGQAKLVGPNDCRPFLKATPLPRLPDFPCKPEHIPCLATSCKIP